MGDRDIQSPHYSHAHETHHFLVIFSPCQASPILILADIGPCLLSFIPSLVKFSEIFLNKIVLLGWQLTTSVVGFDDLHILLND